MQFFDELKIWNDEKKKEKFNTNYENLNQTVVKKFNKKNFLTCSGLITFMGGGNREESWSWSSSACCGVFSEAVAWLDMWLLLLLLVWLVKLFRPPPKPLALVKPFVSNMGGICSIINSCCSTRFVSSSSILGSSIIHVLFIFKSSLLLSTF